MAKTFPETKLCPHCANSIPLDKSQCPYCKRMLSAAAEHEWPEQDSDPVLPQLNPEGGKRNFKPILIVCVTVAILALAAVAMFANRRPSRPPAVAEISRELQEKDQKIQTLEAELAKLRDGQQNNSGQVDEMKAKLDEREKDLASAQHRLAEANREIDRLASSRIAASSTPVGRNAEPLPAPTPARSSAPSRPAGQVGVYETVRSTSVYEEPSGAARVLNQIGKATRINVVRADGEWLEVRSKHGNPPGFIRSDDAMFVARAN
ncbi:MAG TPA: hypothetical protein VNT76_16800 [Candidatus Binatus sp.]|nr:hypothetical protein [Candidatus Binatus sp.]